MEHQRLALKAGTQLDHFQIRSVIGTGFFGITYAALNLRTGSRVAIKELLPPSLAMRLQGSAVLPQNPSLQESWEVARRRFIGEASALTELSHPAIIGVHHIIEANKTAYVVMDFVEGETYESQLLKNGRVTDQASLLAIISPILDGLNAVHEKGALHLNIRPENILINRQGQPILLYNFGSAGCPDATAETKHGYSAFECQTGEGLGPWTDIYSLGAVMCRAITGDQPPIATDRVKQDEFQWLSSRNLKGFSKRFLLAIDSALRVNPGERVQEIDQWAPQLLSENQTTPINPPALENKVVAPAKKDVPPAFSKTSPQSSPRPSPRTNNRSWQSSENTVQLLLTAVVAFSCGIATALFVPAIFPSPRMLFDEGMAYFQGEGVKKDEKRGLKLIRSAAEKNLSKAQWQLAILYQNGKGISKDPAEALKWYREAACRGGEETKIALGKMFFTGEGLTKDTDEGLQWFRKAADQGSADAQNTIGVLYANGQGVPKDLREAFNWYEKAALQGMPVAQNNIGIMYFTGEGTSKDAVEAAKWFRKAADQGLAPAQNNLAIMTLSGEGVTKDAEAAFKWFHKAADQGFAFAQNKLGTMYLNGEGVAKDADEAVKWFKKAAASGDQDAKDWLKQNGVF